MRATGFQEYDTTKLALAPELMQVQKLMPYDPADLKNLREDIERNGIRNALDVYRGEDGRMLVLGGATRLKIALDLRHARVPIRVLSMPPEEREAFAIQDNLNRRHLTSAQRTLLVGHLLRSNPSMSDREAGRKIGMDHKGVARHRRKLEKTGGLPRSALRLGKDGRQRNVPVRSTTGKRETNAESTKIQNLMESIPFLVVYCKDLEKSRQFYESCGLRFNHEQHGTGPVHYTASVGLGLLELYPAKEDFRIMLGLPGEKRGARIDPDGNRVTFIG